MQATRMSWAFACLPVVLAISPWKISPTVPVASVSSRKVVLAEGRLGEYGPGFLRAGFCLPRLVFRPKLQHGQLRGRRQNPGG